MDLPFVAMPGERVHANISGPANAPLLLAPTAGAAVPVAVLVTAYRVHITPVSLITAARRQPQLPALELAAGAATDAAVLGGRILRATAPLPPRRTTSASAPAAAGSAGSAADAAAAAVPISPDAVSTVAAAAAAAAPGGQGGPPPMSIPIMAIDTYSTGKVGHTFTVTIQTKLLQAFTVGFAKSEEMRRVNNLLGMLRTGVLGDMPAFAIHKALRDTAAAVLPPPEQQRQPHQPPRQQPGAGEGHSAGECVGGESTDWAGGRSRGGGAEDEAEVTMGADGLPLAVFAAGWGAFDMAADTRRQLSLETHLLQAPPPLGGGTPDSDDRRDPAAAGALPLGIGTDLRPWFRTTTAEQPADRYGTLATYPPAFVAPASVSDADLLKAAEFRSRQRIPAVSFVHLGTGAVLARCSQPMLRQSDAARYADASLCAALTLPYTDVTRRPRGGGGAGVGAVHSAGHVAAAAAAAAGLDSSTSGSVGGLGGVSPRPPPSLMASGGSATGVSGAAPPSLFGGGSGGFAMATPPAQQKKMAPPPSLFAPRPAVESAVDGGFRQPTTTDLTMALSTDLGASSEAPPAPAAGPTPPLSSPVVLSNGVTLVPCTGAPAGPSRTLMVIDLRPMAAASGNKAMGGGYESGQYYEFCRVSFAGIDNIHGVNSAWSKMRNLVATHCAGFPATMGPPTDLVAAAPTATAAAASSPPSDGTVQHHDPAQATRGAAAGAPSAGGWTAGAAAPIAAQPYRPLGSKAADAQDARSQTQLQSRADFMSAWEATGWPGFLQRVIWAGTQTAEHLNRGESVLTHCTDGWDRTSQTTALAMLLLDPYYRTVRGFCALLEREWLSFGHKFAERCRHEAGGETAGTAHLRAGLSDTDTTNEPKKHSSPVFLQWLDAVHQVWHQFPTRFEFGPGLLEHVAVHTYSCYFGTFLCNGAKERRLEGLPARTISLWAEIERLCLVERAARGVPATHTSAADSSSAACNSSSVGMSAVDALALAQVCGGFGPGGRRPLLNPLFDATQAIPYMHRARGAGIDFIRPCCGSKGLRFWREVYAPHDPDVWGHRSAAGGLVPGTRFPVGASYPAGADALALATAKLPPPPVVPLPPLTDYGTASLRPAVLAAQAAHHRAYADRSPSCVARVEPAATAAAAAAAAGGSDKACWNCAKTFTFFSKGTECGGCCKIFCGKCLRTSPATKERRCDSCLALVS